MLDGCPGRTPRGTRTPDVRQDGWVRTQSPSPPQTQPAAPATAIKEGRPPSLRNLTRPHATAAKEGERGLRPPWSKSRRRRSRTRRIYCRCARCGWSEGCLEEALSKAMIVHTRPPKDRKHLTQPSRPHSDAAFLSVAESGSCSERNMISFLG